MYSKTTIICGVLCAILGYAALRTQATGSVQSALCLIGSIIMGYSAWRHHTHYDNAQSAASADDHIDDALHNDAEDTGMTCPKCGSDNVRVQAVTDVHTKHRGCFGWVLWILLALCTFGLIIIIPLITNSKTKSSTHTEAVCQSCGNRWRV